MKIRSLKLHPFGGLTNHTIEFNDSLNVICGPNEAGKSTTVRALWFVLFVKTNLTPAREKTVIGRFLPVTGGDTINVSLEFSVNDEIYIIRKSWGGNKYSELTLPGGNIITDAEKVQQKLDELLLFNAATYRHILFTYQSDLAKTFEQLRESGDAATSLSDLLRNAVMSQGGVSTEKLIELLEAKKKEYFDNWDHLLDSPRNNKDIDNPHKKNVGKILTNYYKYQILEEELKRTQEYELQVDKAVKEISVSEEKLIAKQKFVNENKETIKDARERKNLELQYDKLKSEQKNLNEIYSMWPELELKRNSLQKEKNKLCSLLENISEELLNAEKRDSLKTLKEKFKTCSILNNKISELKKDINKSQKITGKDVEAAKHLENKIKNNSIKIEAQKLKLSILSKKILNISLTSGLDKTENILLNENENKVIDVNGGFEIETAELKLSASSGNENIDELITGINENKKQLEDYLKKFNVTNILELQVVANHYENLNIELEKIQSNLKTALGEISYEELEKTVEESNEIPLARETNLLRNLKYECAANLKSIEDQLLELNKEISELNEKYKSKDELLNLLVNIKSLLKETETVLGNLLPLPDTFKNTDEFIRYYEAAADEFNELKEVHHKLLIKRAELDKDKPQFDTKELEIELFDAKKDLERSKKEGEAYLMISKKVANLLDGTETQTYLPLQQVISNYFSEITNEKYHEVLLNRTLPVRIENNNKGFEIHQLSKGTLDALALATRLGMAEFYLRNTDGFLILDDPFVDLDEKRQSTAALAINKFAENKQVIVFTCHKNHAKILNENYYSMAMG